MQHNIPLAVSDHLGPLFKDVFSDSKIAKAYSSARTKSTSMVNGALASHYRDELVTKMQKEPFALAIDGSSDNGIKKMNPLTVRVFDINKQRVTTQFLDMCLTTGKTAGTAETIFSKVDAVMTTCQVPWENCFGVAMDNASVNMGRRNSMKTRFLGNNPNMYVMGCPCHIVHNTACHASQEFEKKSHYDAEDFCVDLFYWFDKSTQRKSVLADYYKFCDLEYRQIIKQVNTLSLEKTIKRIIEQYAGLKSYFQSEQASQARFKRLAGSFEKPMTEVFLIFYNNILSTFTTFNKFLQREDPCIYLMADQCNQFIKKLLGKFVKIRAIKEANKLSSVKFEDRGNQLDDQDLAVGSDLKEKLIQMEDYGDISPAGRQIFYRAARSYFVSDAIYAMDRLPLEDELLQHARFVNLDIVEDCMISDVEYFTSHFRSHFKFSPADLNKMQEEFVDLQLLSRSDIPQRVWEEAKVVDEDEKTHYHRMDVIWAYLSQMKTVEGTIRFSHIAKVARAVLILPHSNAEEERVFSLVTKNKTVFRPNLALDGTLSSLVTVKLASPESSVPCYKFEPTDKMLKDAKKATMAYNTAHSSTS